MAAYDDEIKLLASDFRSKNRLSESEPIDCKNLVLRLNVLTVYKLLSDDFSGMCLKRNENRFILINAKHSKGRQHFTIAHELYHLFIQDSFAPHYCNPGSKTRDINEQKADLFASNLLMPEMGIKMNIPNEERVEKEISLATLLKLERIFSVSHMAMLIRLKELKLISSNEFIKFSNIPICQTALMHGYDTSLYEGGNQGLVIGDYGILAKEKYDNEKISEGHYRKLLSEIGIDLTKINHVED